MTADNPAATATADTNAAPDPTTATATTATNAPTPEGSQVTPQEGQPTNEAKTDAGAKPGVQAAPDSYTFTLPDGMEVDTALAESVSPILKEAGVSQEAAQKLAQAFVEHIKAQEAKAPEAYAQMRAQEVAKQSAEWRKATEADPEIGGANFKATHDRVIGAVGQLATPEFRAEMDAHGWGNHPELIRFINRCIDYVPPETGERAAGAGGSNDMLSRLYQNT